MKTPPRPTMSEADKRALREFLDSPAGRRVLADLNKLAQADVARAPNIDTSRPASPDGGYSGPGDWLGPLDVEAASSDPLDPLRPFPPPPTTSAPAPLAHDVSVWPVIIAAIVSTLACASLIALFVAAALKGTP